MLRLPIEKPTKLCLDMIGRTILSLACSAFVTLMGPASFFLLSAASMLAGMIRTRFLRPVPRCFERRQGKELPAGSASSRP